MRKLLDSEIAGALRACEAYQIEGRAGQAKARGRAGAITGGMD
jgi:hypothetical protein